MQVCTCLAICVVLVIWCGGILRARTMYGAILYGLYFVTTTGRWRWWWYLEFCWRSTNSSRWLMWTTVLLLCHKFQIRNERTRVCYPRWKIIYVIQYCSTCPHVISISGGSVGVTRWMASAEFGVFSTHGEPVVCEASFGRTTRPSMRTKYNNYERQLLWSISRWIPGFER